MELSENISSEGSRETTTDFQTIGDRGFRPLVLNRFYQVFWRDESFHVHLGTIFFRRIGMASVLPPESTNGSG